jgi:hypothetical protein
MAEPSRRAILPRMSGKPWWASAVAGAVLWVAATARGDEGGTVNLAWSAPSGCPAREDVLAQVARLTGEARSRQPWHAIAAVERAPEGGFALHVTMELDGHREERDLRATSCTQLADAAAVVLAVAVDGTLPSEGDASLTTIPTPAATPPPSPPAFVASTALPSIAPTTSTVATAHAATVATTPAATSAATVATTTDTAPTTPRAPAAPDARLVPPRAPPRSSFALAALGMQSLGQLGDSAFGGGLAFAWRLGGVRVEVQGAWFPQSHVNGATAGTSGDFGLWLSSLTGCWSPVLGVVSLGGCAGAEGGQIDARATGSRVVTPVATQSLWASIKAGALLVWNVTPSLALRTGADAVAPLVRNSFFVSDVGDVYTPPPVTARWHAGVEVQFR